MTDRSGAAIPFVLLLSLALYAMSWGAFVSASAAVRSARSAVDLAEMTSASQALVAREVAGGPGDWADTLSVDATVTRRDSMQSWPAELTWTRLTAEAWLVQAAVFPGVGAPVPVMASRLAWRPDPAVRMNELSDLTVGPGAAVTMAGVAPAMVSVDVADSVEVGLLTLDDLRAGALPLAGPVTPRSVTRSGHCDRSIPSNLGDPFGVSACRSFVAHRSVDARVELRGGTGHVLLVGRGDVVLTGGAEVVGMIITEGSVQMIDATFRGTIVAIGGIDLGQSALFVTDRGAARQALDAFVTEHPTTRALHSARTLFGG